MTRRVACICFDTHACSPHIICQNKINKTKHYEAINTSTYTFYGERYDAKHRRKRHFATVRKCTLSGNIYAQLSAPLQLFIKCTTHYLCFARRAIIHLCYARVVRVQKLATVKLFNFSCIISILCICLAMLYLYVRQIYKAYNVLKYNGI